MLQHPEAEHLDTPARISNYEVSGRPVQGLMMVVGTQIQGKTSKSEITVLLLIQNVDVHNASSQICRERLQNFDIMVHSLTLRSLLYSLLTTH